jgi:hypothetical protein
MFKIDELSPLLTSNLSWTFPSTRGYLKSKQKPRNNARPSWFMSDLSKSSYESFPRFLVRTQGSLCTLKDIAIASSSILISPKVALINF